MKKLKLFSAFILLCFGLNANALEQVDGVYQIGSPEEMSEFANLVNEGNYAISAKLTADIDFSAYNMVIGPEGKYQGTFDGDGHRLTIAIDHPADGAGLFSRIDTQGKICNLIVDGTISGTTGMGTFAWESWGTIENCVSLVTITSSASGFASNAGISCACYGGSTFRNCLFAGKLIGANASGFAGLSCWVNSATVLMENCIIAPAEVEMAEGNNFTISQFSDRTKLINCFSTTELGNTPDDCTMIETDVLASGELCYQLNGHQDDIVWRQNLGEDEIPYPFGNHGQVYANGVNCAGKNMGDAEYSNEHIGDAPAHQFDGVTCTVCGANALEQIDGVYQIGNAEEMLAFANLVNGGNYAISAKLTADIDFSAYNMVIGSGGKYQGTFDGDGHKLTIAIDHPADGAGLFSQIDTKGKICNLIVDGTMSGTTGMGTFAWESWGTIENCVSLVTISSSASGFASNAGISCACYGGSTFRNCLFAGKLIGANASGFAGLSCWVNSATVRMENCVIAPAEVIMAEGSNFTISQFSDRTMLVNCYSTAELGNTPSDCNMIDSGILASGELCFMMNGDQTALNWYQNIGEDEIPYPFSNHGQVYANGVNCAGKNMGDAKYSNEHIGEIPDHQFNGLVCTVCGAERSDYVCEMEDGYYLIKSLDDFQWFVSQVNNGKLDINAKLTCDIDYSSVNQMVAVNGNYKGTFDGCFHKITVGFERNEECAALFKGIASEGKVCNLVVDGTITTNRKFAAGIVSNLYGKIENCVSLVTINSNVQGDGTHGGIAAQAYTDCVIRNSIFAGSILGSETTDCGGLIGYIVSNPAYVYNCAVAPKEITIIPDGSNTFSRRNNYLQMENSFYVNEIGETSDGSTKVSSASVSTGELCFLMNGDQTDINWYQNIGEDKIPYPFNSHGQVYAKGVNCAGKNMGSAEYSNEHIGDIPSHQFSGFVCSVCGGLKKDYVCEMEDGYYLIKSLDDFQWFVYQINNGYLDINAKLTCDIDYSSDNTRIAYNGKYQGTFDGCGHKITVGFNRTVDGTALFDRIGENGKLCNLVIDGSLQGTTGMGTFAWECWGTLENCVSLATLTSTHVGAGTNGGLICACYGGSLVKNCIFAGSLLGSTASDFGGLLGWVHAPMTVENCIVAPVEVGMSTSGSDTFARNNNNAKLINCYYVEKTGSLAGGAIQFNKEDLASGKLCFTINKGNVECPTWYQNIGEDAVPYPMSSHGTVYELDEDTYMDVHDDASLKDFQNVLVMQEMGRLNDALVYDEIAVEYEPSIQALSNAETREDFNAAYVAWQTAKVPFINNANAYLKYTELAKEIQNSISENGLSGNATDILVQYLTGNSEPGDVYPNGSYLYITSGVTLDTDGVLSEISYMEQLYNNALIGDYGPNADISDLLVNADFSQGSMGWNGKAATAFDVNLPLVECYNNTCDMYQTLTGLKNGVYELRMNALFRPAGRDDSRFATSYLYANDQIVPVMNIQEDAVAFESAVNNENCYIDNIGTHPYDNLMDDTGYVPNSVTGAAIAFKAGRYENKILVNVTDGTLTVGIRAEGTGSGSDWTPFNNAKLYYRGELSEAGSALSNILAGQAARAQYILDGKTEVGEYAYYPNFSQTLRTELQNAIDASTTATGETEMYELESTFSSLFGQVQECQKAYIQMMTFADRYYASVSDIHSAGALDDEAYNNLLAEIDNTTIAYEDGSVDASTARSWNIYNGNKDGECYLIANENDLVMFAILLNSGMPSLSAKLTADIDFSSKNIILCSKAKYNGTFDGDGHKLTIAIDHPADGAGLFSQIDTNGKICNLIVDGTMSGTTGMGTFAWESWGTIENCVSLVTITSSASGFASNAGISCACYGGSTFRNCLFAGKLIGENASGFAGLSCWVNSATVLMENCAIAPAEVEMAEGNNFTISQFSDRTNLVNCYSTVELGNTPGNCNMVDSSALVSGELCYLLNGDQSNIAWYQTIGEDAYPVPFPARGMVTKDADGAFINTGIQQINSEKMNGSIYNIMGQKVQKTHKGIYVVNGKKILVK